MVLILLPCHKFQLLFFTTSCGHGIFRSCTAHKSTEHFCFFIANLCNFLQLFSILTVFITAASVLLMPFALWPTIGYVCLGPWSIWSHMFCYFLFTVSQKWAVSVFSLALFWLPTWSTIMVFKIIILLSMIDGYHCLRGTCCLHLEDPDHSMHITTFQVSDIQSLHV